MTIAYLKASRLVVGVSCLLLIALSLSADRAQAGGNGYCWLDGPYWHCMWGASPAASGDRVWFTAGNSKRVWTRARIQDDYNGNVRKKCVGVKYESGEIYALACGPGAPLGYALHGGAGWLYINQWTGGPRNITGHGHQYQ